MQVLADVWRYLHDADEYEEQPEQYREAPQHQRGHLLRVLRNFDGF